MRSGCLCIMLCDCCGFNSVDVYISLFCVVWGVWDLIGLFVSYLRLVVCMVCGLV